MSLQNMMTDQNRRTHSLQQIKAALNRVSQLVNEGGIPQDIQYFEYHKGRYLRMAIGLSALPLKSLCVLNIGSHYLHSSLLLQFLGYDVYSMDVTEFWDLEFVQKRQRSFDIKKVVDNNLERLDSQAEVKGKYDVVLFTEILEHITFNPINFWKKIYSLVKTEGYIYISTPNSMSLVNIIRSLARILTLRGIGEPVNEIFKKVTYGHHWKEYSSSEIRKYFSKMSEDFTVKIKKYDYIDHKINSFPTAIIAFLAYVGNITYLFAEDLEAIVHVEKTGKWKIEPPEY